MNFREIALAISEERFSLLVNRATRKGREEVLKACGIRRATHRILDPKKRRKVAITKLRDWIESEPGGGNEVAFRLMYNVLSGALRPMVITILDQRGISHESGITDDLSQLNSIDSGALISTLSALSGEYDAADIALYFQFTAVDPEFDGLREALEGAPGCAEALRA